MVRNAILVLLFSLSAAVVKAVDYTNGGVWNDPDHNGAPIRYFVDNGCAIIGTEGGGAALSDNYYEYFHSDRHLAIPSQINGFAVVGIASNAFYQTSEGYPIDLNYSIPESVTNIGVNAFGEYPEKCIVDGWLLALNSNFYDCGTDSGTIVLPKCIRGIADGVLRQDDLRVKFLGNPPVHWPTREPTSYDKIWVSIEFENEWSKEIVCGKWRGMYVVNWDGYGVPYSDLERDGPDCGNYEEWIVDDNGFGMKWYYSVTNTCRYRVRQYGEVERIEDERFLTNGYAIIQKCDYSSYSYNLSGRDVCLPTYLGGHPVREIGEGVFSSSMINGSVSISSNITVIGANAFSGSSITNITIPPSVTNIMEGAFSGCGYLGCQSLDGLRGVIKDGWVLSVQEAWEVPDGIKGIAGGAFAACSSVGVSLPTSVVYICNGAFACAKVHGVTVREGNPHFCSVDGTLYNADKTVLIRAGAPDYGNYGRFVVPTGVVDVCDYAFFGNGLKDVNIPDTVRHIGRWAFAGCFDEGVTIKDGWLLTVVGDDTSVRLPYNIRGIADGALHDRFDKASYNNRKTLESIPCLEFMGYPPTFAPSMCIGLSRDVRLHSRFKDSWDAAINGTSTYDAVADTWVVTKPWIGYHQWIDPQPDGGPYQGPDEVGRMWWYSVVNGESIVQRPPGGYYFYASQNSGWEGHEWMKAEVVYDEYGREIGIKPLVLPATLGDHPVRVIADGAFSGGEIRVDQIVLSSNITSIGVGAFRDCSQLGKVNIPSSVTNIATDAFLNCPLSCIRTDGLAMVDGWLLSASGNVGADVTIPSGVKRIADGAFSSVQGEIETISIPASVESIGTIPFLKIESDGRRKNSLQSIVVEDGNRTYCSEDGVLFSADKRDLILYPVMREGGYLVPTGTVRICDYAFAGDGMRVGEVILPDSIESIGASAFYGNNVALTNIIFDGRPPECGMRAFGENREDLNGVYMNDVKAWHAAMNATHLDKVPLTELPAYTTAWHYCSIEEYVLPMRYVIPWPRPDGGTFTEEVNGIEWSFYVSDGKAYLSRRTSTNLSGDITLPTMLGGREVVGIGEYALMELDAVHVIRVPASISEIGSYAFAWCNSLTNIVFEGNQPTNVGAYAFMLNGCTIVVDRKASWDVTIPGHWNGCPITYPPIYDPGLTVTADKVDGMTFARRTTVSLTTKVPCVIYYTTDDTVPSRTSQVYDEPIVVSSSVCLKYFAVSQSVGDWGPMGGVSLTRVAAETDEIETSVSIPDGTTFAGSQVVELMSSGTEIYYTIDGSNPTDSLTRKKYDGPIKMAETTILKYYAVDAFGDWGPVKTATYVWKATDGWYREKIEGVVWGGTIVNGCVYNVRAYSEDRNGGLISFDYNGDIRVPQIIGNCPVVSLSKSAFSKTEITSSTIPLGVEVIARDAFRECMSLTNVVIPASVTNIGYFAFRDCRKLKTIILNCDPAIAAAGAFDGTPAAVAAPRLNGFVTVIAEIKGSGAISVPESWSAKYPGFVTRYGTDFAKALMSKSGKVAADGTSLLVWHDFVAGTDPTDENDQFTASITFDDNGKPIIKYTPELTAEQTSLRKYTTWGKVRLQDVNWVEVSAGNEAGYNFFKVTVEMRE